jgi:hypothetical protein
MFTTTKVSRAGFRQNTSRWILSWAAAALLTGSPALLPAQSFSGFTPGNLVVSRSVYTGTAATVTVGETLPPDCPSTAVCTGSGVGGPATNTGAFPVVGSTNNVWSNADVDGSFGVTSPIFLDQISTGGTLINSLAIPTSGANEIVTSFSSKSELALNLSLDGSYITFMGYTTSPNTLDVSNGNTPGLIDPTNPSGIAVFRGVAQVDTNGNLVITDTNAYSGDNGRAAIFTGAANGNVYFTVGNDNNGTEKSGTVFTELIGATGAQVITPGATPGSPGTLQAGAFNITEEGDPADKTAKDNNFRGLTIFNNTLYVTKGSGSNGIDTVYQVGTAGTLPTAGDPSGALTINVLPGFPTAIAKTAGVNNIYPFGIWFANSTTLYVADEGDGVVADAPNSIYAGLQKWSLVSGSWQLDYVLQNGLNLGQQYGLPNYPPALNPAIAGLRNLTGRVNGDGTVTIWAVTSAVSANGDQGADPNKLVTITDNLVNTNPTVSAGEQFTTLRSAGYGEVLRGVSFAPAGAPGAISLPANTTVGLGQSGQLPITLSAPAPDGGVTVTLTSSDPTTVTVTPTVFVSGGETSPRNIQPQVTGLNLGTAAITLSAPYYVSSSQQVQVTGSLSFARRLTIFASATQTATLNLSGPAPAGGLIINLSSDNTGVATVPPTVTFPAGATSVNALITGVAGGNTLIHASNASLPTLTAAAVNVTVVVPEP